jgi:hypothetical protein
MTSDEKGFVCILLFLVLYGFYFAVLPHHMEVKPIVCQKEGSSEIAFIDYRLPKGYNDEGQICLEDKMLKFDFDRLRDEALSLYRQARDEAWDKCVEDCSELGRRRQRSQCRATCRDTSEKKIFAEMFLRAE